MLETILHLDIFGLGTSEFTLNRLTLFVQYFLLIIEIFHNFSSKFYHALWRIH